MKKIAILSVISFLILACEKTEPYFANDLKFKTENESYQSNDLFHISATGQNEDYFLQANLKDDNLIRLVLDEDSDEVTRILLVLDEVTYYRIEPNSSLNFDRNIVKGTFEGVFYELANESNTLLISEGEFKYKN